MHFYISYFKVKNKHTQVLQSWFMNRPNCPHVFHGWEMLSSLKYSQPIQRQNKIQTTQILEPNSNQKLLNKPYHNISPLATITDLLLTLQWKHYFLLTPFPLSSTQNLPHPKPISPYHFNQDLTHFLSLNPSLAASRTRPHNLLNHFCQYPQAGFLMPNKAWQL